jgi:hypothetical protein
MVPFNDRVGEPAVTNTPPPLAAVLSLSVELLSVAVEPLLATPPPPLAEFPLTVEFVMASVPFKEAIPPPRPAGAELPLIVELFTVNVASGPEL